MKFIFSGGGTLKECDKEAIQTRDYCVATPRRFARIARLLRSAKSAALRMTTKPYHYHNLLKFLEYNRRFFYEHND